MLNSILNRYTKKSDSKNTDTFQEEAPAPKNIKHNKNNIEDSHDFLNENDNLSMKKKCDDVLKKYCNLYTEEEETGPNKFSVKPLNYRYTDQKQRRVQHAKTTGDGWFNMKAPEMTPELREDLKAVQLRHIIDPGRFYKKLDKDNLPKFFQMGTILDNIVDGKRNRLKKSEVKSRLAEQFLEEDREKKYSLRKFEELQGQRRKIGLKKTKLNKYKLKSKKTSKRSGFIVK